MLKKEDFLSLFVISLALIACSVLVYMVRTPSLTGNVALNGNSSITVISVLILVGIVVVINAVVSIHKIHEEKEMHKNALIEKESPSTELATYVFRARKYGFTDEEIKEKLNEQNWDKKDINTLFKK